MKKWISFSFAALMIFTIGCDNVTLNLPVQKKAAYLSLVSIEITPANISIMQGEKMQYTAIGTYDDNNSVDITDEVLWSSANTEIVSIDSSGLATAVSPGIVFIKAELGSIHSDTNLNITDKILVSIHVTPCCDWIPQEGTRQYTATAYYLDESSRDITNEITWSTSDPMIATINDSGFAEGISTGVVDIIARKLPILGSTQITVYSPHVP